MLHLLLGTFSNDVSNVADATKVTPALIVAYFTRLRDIAASHGTVSVAKIMGWCWRLPRPLAQLRKLGFEFIEVPGTGKNSTDIRLAIEATRDLMNEASLTHLVIASGDNDFTPLAVEAQHMGCRVVGLLPVGLSGQRWTRVLDQAHSVMKPVVKPQLAPPPQKELRAVRPASQAVAEPIPVQTEPTKLAPSSRLMHVLPWALREAFAQAICRICAREGVLELPLSLLPRALQSLKDAVRGKGVEVPTTEVLLRGCLDLVGISLDETGDRRLHLTPEGFLSLGMIDQASFR